jgi:hypothetical protein
MKRIVCGLMMAVWLATMIIGGCSQESAPSTSQNAPIAQFDLSTAKAMVTHFSRDSQRREVQVDVQLVWAGGEVSKNVVTFSAQTRDNAWDGAHVSLGDEHGRLLWEYTLGWDVNDMTWVRITERTDKDVLSIRKLPTAGMITEEYEFNGKQKSFTYPQSLTDGLSNPKTAALTEADQALLEKLRGEFQNFYNSDNSLSENRYGVLLTELLSDDGFRAWLKSSIKATQASVVPNRKAVTDDSEKTKDIICVIADICSTFKCSWTGLVNPVCVPCIGISLACLIADIVELL